MMATRVELITQNDKATTVTVEDCGRIIEVGIETDTDGAYADMDIDTAKQFLAALAVAIARAELQG